MEPLKPITFDPRVMDGQHSIRGMRVTVGRVVGMVAASHSREEILELNPYLEREDIDEALSYAARRTGGIDVLLVQPTRGNGLLT